MFATNRYCRDGGEIDTERVIAYEEDEAQQVMEEVLPADLGDKLELELDRLVISLDEEDDLVERIENAVKQEILTTIHHHTETKNTYK